MGLSFSGADELIAHMRHMAEVVPDKARKAMHRGAEKIVKEAQLNAPVDKHNLEDSIRIEKSYGERGRLQIDIVVGGFVRGVNVSVYAVEVHEAYETSIAPGGPGPGTAAKMRANPDRIIGSKFLDRAVEDQRKKLIAATVAAVTEAIRQ